MKSFTAMLRAAETRAQSLLCVGLDPEPARFPGSWRGDASRIHDFCAAIVDATHDLKCDRGQRRLVFPRRLASRVLIDIRHGEEGPPRM